MLYIYYTVHIQGSYNSPNPPYKFLPITPTATSPVGADDEDVSTITQVPSSSSTTYTGTTQAGTGASGDGLLMSEKYKIGSLGKQFQPQTEASPYLDDKVGHKHTLLVLAILHHTI